jgi:hypothetical protein
MHIIVLLAADLVTSDLFGCLQTDGFVAAEVTKLICMTLLFFSSATLVFACLERVGLKRGLGAPFDALGLEPQ